MAFANTIKVKVNANRRRNDRAMFDGPMPEQTRWEDYSKAPDDDVEET